MVTKADEDRWRSKLRKQGHDDGTIAAVIKVWRDERAALDLVFAGVKLGPIDPDDIAGPHCNED